MRKFVFFAVLSTLFTFSAMALEKETPPCHLGTAWSVNPDRQIESWEKSIRTPSGVIADVTQREKPGSSHIVTRRCKLPEDTEVIYGGVGGPWIKVCGNGMSNIEGWTIPIHLPRGPRGYQGDRGEKGDKGDKGELLIVVRPWHDPCTRTTTRKVVCTALAIGLGSAAGYALSNDAPDNTCHACQY